MCDRSGQPVVASWARTHEFQSSFAHEKAKHVILEEEETHDRTGESVVCPQRVAMRQQFIIGDDEAELELSLGSRSFVNRVNDQVRKRQKRSSMNVTGDCEKHSKIWGMFMSVTLESAFFMGKNFSDNQHSIKNKRSHIETNVRRICTIGVRTRRDLWIEPNSLGRLFMEVFFFGDEQVISLQRTKVYVFSDSVLCLCKIHENSQSNDAWEQ